MNGTEDTKMTKLTLQEQLLKAGLVTSKKMAKVQRTAKKSRIQAREAREAVEENKKAQIERDKQLSEQQKQAVLSKEYKAQVKQLIEMNKIDISKGSTRFCSYQRIEIEVQKLFSAIDYGNTLVELSRDDLIIAIAELYADMNVVHPFREGNGRAQRVLFEHMIINCGYDIDWSIVEADEWLEANIKGYYCDYSLMRSIFEKCIGSAF